MNGPVFIDSHAHFDLCLEDGGSEEEYVTSLASHGVGRAVQVSIDAEGLAWSRDFAARNRSAGILFTAGIHPSSRAEEADLERLRNFVEELVGSADADLLFGIGETGLDFFRMHQPADMQRRSFEFQLDLAARHNLPVIVHSRDAAEDALAILRAKKPPLGVMHCFSGDGAMAKRFLDLGFYISFAGNLTYRTAADLHDAASYVPMDRLLLETDAPFLTPVPLRGKKNRPEYVVHTYEFIAALRKEPVPSLQELVFQNFTALTRR